MMTYSTKKTGDTLVVALAGRLDSDAASGLDASFDTWMTQEFRTLALDFSALEYTSSIGLRSLIRAAKALKAAGREFLLCNPQPTVKQVFRIAGLLSLIPISDSVPGKTA
jgi:anti-anti-sigma factor